MWKVLLHRCMFLCLLTVAEYSIGQEPLTTSRIWTSSDGKKVSGSVVDQDGTSVTLQIPGRPTASKIPLSRLCNEDQTLLRAMWLDRQDRQQFDQVKEQLRNVTAQPKTVTGLLIALHTQYPESPYAGLWAAVTLCVGENEHDRAAAMLRQTIERINKQQAVDPTRHQMTLCSANNNLAVCMIKSRKGDSAAARMIDAIGMAKQLPSVVSSNACLLNECTSDPSAMITFSPSVRVKLLNAVALANSAGTGTDLPKGWHYSLDFNVPAESAASTKLDGIDAPRSGLQLLASGSGFVAAPGIVLTSRPVIETTNYVGPKLVTILNRTSNSEYRSELVESLLAETSRTFASSATVSSQSDGSSGVWTNYSYIHPEAGESGAELAALRVPGLATTPAEISERDPTNRSELTVLGYLRGADMLSQGLQEQRGQAIVSPGMRTTRGLPITARVMGGNRGGPVVDRDGAVVGIAFDTPPSGLEEQGLFFGAGELRRWFYKNVQTAQLRDVSQDDDAAVRLARVKEATVPVLTWGLPQASQQKVFSDVSDNSRLGAGLYLRDQWCLACDGKGFLDCTVVNCNQGAISDRALYQWDVTRFRGKRAPLRRSSKRSAVLAVGGVYAIVRTAQMVASETRAGLRGNLPDDAPL